MEKKCAQQKKRQQIERVVCVCVLFIVQLVEKAGDKSWGMRHEALCESLPTMLGKNNVYEF